MTQLQGTNEQAKVLNMAIQKIVTEFGDGRKFTSELGSVHWAFGGLLNATGWQLMFEHFGVTYEFVDMYVFDGNIKFELACQKVLDIANTIHGAMDVPEIMELQAMMPKE